MDYSHMTAAELRTVAKEKGVKKASSLKKQELIEAIEALEKEAAEAIKETFSEDVQDAEVQNEEDGTEAVAVNEGEDTEAGEGPGAEGEEGSDENKAFVPPFKKNDAAFVKGDIKEGVLEIMPDGFGFIRSENFLPATRMFMFLHSRSGVLHLGPAILWQPLQRTVCPVISSTVCFMPRKSTASM